MRSSFSLIFLHSNSKFFNVCVVSLTSARVAEFVLRMGTKTHVDVKNEKINKYLKISVTKS